MRLQDVQRIARASHSEFGKEPADDSGYIGYIDINYSQLVIVYYIAIYRALYQAVLYPF